MSDSSAILPVSLPSPEVGAAPGYRHRDYGTLYAVGNSGYSWSSSIAGTNAHNLGFYYSWLNPQDSSGRANGLQLRCLQEEGRRWAPPGYRDSGDANGYGALWCVGDHGVGWSSSFTDSYVHYLRFRFNVITPQYGHHRAHGLQLRCLQER